MIHHACSSLFELQPHILGSSQIDQCSEDTSTLRLRLRLRPGELVYALGGFIFGNRGPLQNLRHAVAFCAGTHHTGSENFIKSQGHSVSLTAAPGGSRCLTSSVTCRAMAYLLQGPGPRLREIKPPRIDVASSAARCVLCVLCVLYVLCVGGHVYFP
jgi:hypothetical protein